MYNVSQKFKEAIARPGQFYRLTGTVGEINFTDSDVLSGSLEVTMQASSSTDVNLGGVFIGQLDVVFLPGRINIQRGQWTNKEIKIKIGLQLDDGTFEDVPFQPFTVTEADWSAEGVNIKAVDAMAKFDKAATFNTTSGTPEQLLTYLCSRAGVTFGMSAAQIQALPNGREILGIDPESQGQLKTYRDILGWLAQALGCFATINRSGALELRTFTGSNKGRVESNVRYKGGRYSDFTTRYTGMSVVNSEDKVTNYYHIDPDDGLVMNLGSNPFLQLGLPPTVKEIRESILNEISKIQYTPFDIDTVPNPAIDLGDLLTFPDGLGAGVIGCVMATELKYKQSLTIEGFGKNPSLASAESKFDKELGGLSANQNMNTTQWFAYENISEIILEETEKTVSTIRFGNSKETDVDIWAEFKIDASNIADRQRIYAYYFLDGNAQSYQPIDTWSEDGYHLLNLNYHITNLEMDGLHTFEIRLAKEGGDAVIHIGDGHVVMSGIALAESKEWDGLIDVSDKFRIPLSGRFEIARFDTVVQANVQEPQRSEIAEVLDIPLNGSLGFALEDKCDVLGLLDVYEIITEDQTANITTEDQESLIVTEYLKDFAAPTSEE